MYRRLPTFEQTPVGKAAYAFLRFTFGHVLSAGNARALHLRARRLRTTRERLDRQSARAVRGVAISRAFAIGARPSVADISMMAYLHYPADETGYDLATSHPAINAWLGRMAQLPGWKSAYDLLPGKRLTHYAK